MGISAAATVQPDCLVCTRFGATLQDIVRPDLHLMSPEPRAPFPTGAQAIALIIALFLLEVLVGSMLVSANPVLGLDNPAVSALTVLLANGLMLSAVMHWTGLSYRQLFHPSAASPRSVLGLVLPPVLLTVPLLVLSLGTLTDWLEQLVPLSPWEVAMFEQMSTLSLPVVVVTCVLAPVLEEMLFRGVMLRSFLMLYPRWQAILGSAILFGLAHLNLYQFFVALVIGTLAGWLYERSRSLLPGIALHGAYNATLTLITASQGPAEAGADAAPSATLWLFSLLAAAVAAAALWFVLGRRAPVAPTSADA
jgi:uncharacterized protein